MISNVSCFLGSYKQQNIIHVHVVIVNNLIPYFCNYMYPCFVMMIYYISDPTLTTNNATEVMELVKDWDSLSQYPVVVLANRLKEIRQRCSTKGEIANECASYYVHYHHQPSWTHLASHLYKCGEFAAVEKLKPFLPLRGKYLMLV